MIVALGSHAALFGYASKDALHSGSSGPGPDRLVIVDLSSGQVLNKVVINGGVRAALMDDQQVIWLARQVNVLYRLPLASGATLQQKPLTSGAGDRLINLSRDNFALLVPKERNTSLLSVLNKSTFEKVDKHPLNDLAVNPFGTNIGDMGDGLNFAAFPLHCSGFRG